MIKLYVLVPVHNRSEKTLNFLKSLYEEKQFFDVEIVIVDDGSTDDTEFKIRQKYEDVTILKGDGNLYWTGAINLGLKYILGIKKDGQYLLIANNDITFDKNFFFYLKKNISNLKINFLLSAIAIDNSSKKTVRSGGIIKSWFLNINQVFFNNKNLSEIKNNEMDVDFVTGRCLICNINTFESIGFFNQPKLPHYAADEEFSIRAKRLGHKIILSLSLKIFVDTSTTGIKFNFWKDGIRSIKFRLFDIRSSSNLITKTNFSFLVAPWYAIPSHLLVSYCKSLLSFFMFKK